MAWLSRTALRVAQVRLVIEAMRSGSFAKKLPVSQVLSTILLFGPGLVFDANWDFIHKTAVADSVYGPMGAMITAKNSTSREVARIGQVA